MYKYYKVIEGCYIALDEQHNKAQMYISHGSNGWIPIKAESAIVNKLIYPSDEITEEDLLANNIPTPTDHKDNLRRKLLNKY